MKSWLPTACLTLGVVLVLVSLAWTAIAPAGSGWTEEKSLRMSALSSQAHVIGGQAEAAKTNPEMHGGRSAAELQAEYDAIKAELKQLGEEAEGKIDAPRTIATYLWWSGLLLALGGGVATLAARG